LPEMMLDEHWGPRFEVAKRISPRYLSGMLLRETSLYVVTLLQDRIRPSSRSR